jgi:hypothetical protein
LINDVLSSSGAVRGWNVHTAQISASCSLKALQIATITSAAGVPRRGDP